eukprot:18472-Rhodomonas_salina.1
MLGGSELGDSFPSRPSAAGADLARRPGARQGLQQLIARLVKFNRSVTRAKMEYQTLLEKYIPEPPDPRP